MSSETGRIQIWCWMDGKPGHENQSLGLLQSLEDRMDCVIHRWKPPLAWFKRLTWKRRWLEEAATLPAPSLILGAGHATHFWIRLSRKRFGGQSIVLMRPTLSSRYDDLLIVPEHDLPRKQDRMLVTRGVLNRIRPGGSHDSGCGLILAGGPCRHVVWSDQVVQKQIESLITSQPQVRWMVTNSRRSPDSMLPFFQNLNQLANVDFVSARDTPPGWVASQLAACAQAWVTADSVSMVYEAITSGAATGLIELEWAARSKLKMGLKTLVQDGLLTPVSQWHASTGLPNQPQILFEADRVADWIVRNFLQSQRTDS